MTPNEMIYQRKSCRSFTKIPVDTGMLDTIKALPLKPLYPNIKIHWDIVSKNQVKCLCPWTTPQLIAVYSEETDGYLENIGFLFQQMDLYLQTMGLGVCWLGMGRMNPKTAAATEGMKFVIMLAFGHPKGTPRRKDIAEFKRKRMEQISDQSDSRLEPARMAPSAVNSQPWYFTHDGDSIHAYCSQLGSRLDVGIALAHLFAANPDTFRFYHTKAPVVTGYHYIGSFTL